MFHVELTEEIMKELTVFALFVGAAFAQTAGPVVLVVDVDNAVQYRSDIADPAKRGTDPGSSTAAAPRAFTDVLFIGDIVAVNGKPAKGLWTSRQYLMNFSPAPAVGFAIADVSRGTIADCKWEFLDADGRFVGALADSGLAPHAVVGGGGAFYGAQGQMAGGTSPNPRAIRVASMSEDPASRRTNGGGTNRIIFHLLPLYRPGIQALWHADFSPVTTANPVRSGETLIIRATGLGPLVPGTTPPGIDPFPTNLAEVNSPVEIAINGLAATVINKVGWPQETSAYRVDIRVPDGLTSGNGVLQMTAAWIPGDPYPVPVR
jgi:uncharacterized protein (TIGR03437 family)